ncbi:PhnD/SsuA/transferrin family substrate-binding protein [Sutterella sp.]|uniref:PhnD/SsuA/transferrin family substrate-binding protein n=1 Tax=Sutterella sp. TaxID=1981025 RepID=UPI003FD86DE7
MPLRTASPFLKTLGRPLGAFVLALLVGAAGAPLFAAEPSAADGVSAASFNLADVRSMQYQEDVLANELVIDEKAAPARPGDFVFAIEETGTNETYLRTMMPLVEALRIASPERRVLVRRIPSREFAQSVKAEKIPFVLATSGTMVSLMDELGAVPLAVRERTLTGGQAAAAAGGLLIVDAKRRELGSLASLKGARVAVESTVSFGPWQWLMGRLIKEGLDPENYFAAGEWRPHDVPDVFNAVLSGDADAGLVSLCTLERMEREGFIDPTVFRPAAVLPGGAGLCRSSTPVLPDWTIGYLTTAQSDAVRRVAAVAFSMPERDGWRWGTRVDLSEVRGLMQALHYGPYAYLDEQTVKGFVKRHAELFLALAALFAFVVFHALRSRHLVRVRTKDLEAALAEKTRMEEEARVSRERLSAIERVGLLSQMSSMFAHELKQPLSSLSNYIGGLKLWNARRPTSDADRAMAEGALDAMTEETARITSIVNRVRGYAKRSTEPLKPCDWTAVIRRAELIVERHDARRVPILTAPGEYLAADPADDRPAMVLGDQLELELLVLNLIRNAGHAAAGERDGFVSVSLNREDGNFMLHVTDNGPKLSPEGFARLTGYGDSVKQEGLGIGLSICRGIADRHGGALRFHQLPTQGICAEVTIEALPDEEENDKKNADGGADASAPSPDRTKEI